MSLSKKFKHIIIWVPFSSFVMGLSIYSLSNFFGPYEKFWAGQKHAQNQERAIASTIGSLELEAYKDYFFNNSMNKYLNYKLSPKLWMDDTRDIQKISITSSFHKSLETILEKKQNYSYQEIFEHNILNKFITIFTSNLVEQGITTGRFQVDIDFTPQFEQSLTYEKELSTNNLVNINSFNLQSELNSKQPLLTETVFNSKIIYGHKRYQYGGGTISIFIDLSNMNQPHLRLRRYFKANKLTEPDVELAEENLKINMLHLVSTKAGKHNFITVDLYKDIDAQTMRAKRDRLEISFGKILPSSNEGGTWISHHMDTENDKALHTGNFFLHGKYIVGDLKLKTKIKLEKLVYSFTKKKFTPRTRTYIQLTERKPANIDKQQEKLILNDIFRNSIADKLVRELELEHFLYESSNKYGGVL